MTAIENAKHCEYFDILHCGGQSNMPNKQRRANMPYTRKQAIADCEKLWAYIFEHAEELLENYYIPKDMELIDQLKGFCLENIVP